MSIYKELLDAVDNGKKFKVDLVDKSLWINKRQIIKKGEIVDEEDKRKEFIKKWDLALHFEAMPLNENVWDVIESLYKEFKYSVPNKHSKTACYFKALLSEELTDAQIAFNYEREFAKAMLEGYILLASLSCWIKWENDKHWFWQSESDKDLIILKEWI